MANEPMFTTPTNIPVVASIKYHPYVEGGSKDWRTATGKTMEGRNGSYQSWMWKLTVIDHPDLAPGTLCVWYSSEPQFMRLSEMNPPKGAKIRFTMRETKHPDTGRTGKKLDIDFADAPAASAPAPASRPAPRQQPQAERPAAQRPAPAQAIRPEPGSEDTFSRALHLHKDLLRHFRENVSVESEPTPDWPAAQAMAATLMIQWEKLGYPVTPWERAERESGAAHAKPAQRATDESDPPPPEDGGGYDDQGIPFSPDYEVV